MNKFEMFQSVVASCDILEPQLTGAWGKGKPGVVDGKPAISRGTWGAIVEIFGDGTDFLVEFFDEDGETIDVVFVSASNIRAVSESELQARRRALTPS